MPAHFTSHTLRASLLCTALVITTPAALADKATDGVETVVVTATRTAQPLAKTGADVSVIDDATLQARQSITLTDVLTTVPGISINRTGGIGQTTSLYVRGAESGQTVTLIDGIRLNDPSDSAGSAAYDDLLLNNIQRIEVLRGSQSALYGSNAMGGVINIITKRGGDTGLTAAAEVGSFNSWRINAAANGSAGPVEFGAAINDFSTKGISTYDTGHESDGTKNISATVNTRTHLNDAVSVDLAGYYVHSHTAYDDGYNYASYTNADSAAYNTHSLYAGYSGINADFFGGRFKNRLALIATTSQRNFYDSAWDTVHLNYAYDGNANRIEYQGTASLTEQTELTFGAESELSSFSNDSYASYMPVTTVGGHKRITSGYGQLQHTLFNQLTLTGGVRIDADDDFGRHTSSKLAAAWQIPGADTTVRASFADGFKAPTLYQLYSASSNPIDTLEPETSKSWEAGIDKSLFAGKLVASVTLFERLTSNQIDFQNCNAPSDAPGCPQRMSAYGYYINVGRSKTSGAEISATAKLTEDVSFTTNYTHMDADNRITGKDLARRAHHLANASLRWTPLAALGLGINAGYVGKRFNDVSEKTRIHAAMTVGLNADYVLTEQWQLYGRIDNLFNDRTEMVPGYGVEGIGASFGIRARL